MLAKSCVGLRPPPVCDEEVGKVPSLLLLQMASRSALPRCSSSGSEEIGTPLRTSSTTLDAGTERGDDPQDRLCLSFCDPAELLVPVLSVALLLVDRIKARCCACDFG